MSTKRKASPLKKIRECTFSYGWDIEDYGFLNNYEDEEASSELIMGFGHQWTFYVSKEFNLIEHLIDYEEDDSRFVFDIELKEFREGFPGNSVNARYKIEYTKINDNKDEISGKIESDRLFFKGKNRISFIIDQDWDFDMIKLKLEFQMWPLKNECETENEITKRMRLDIIKNKLSNKNFNFSELLNANDFCDFEIVSASKSFKVHKVVLAAHSAVFKTMLQSGLKESSDNQLIISDFSENIVKKMIDYLYFASFENWSEDLTELDDLVRISEKYNLEGFKLLCEKRVLEIMNLDNCGELYIMTHFDPAFSTLSLLEIISAFIKENSEKLKKNPNFELKAKEFPELFLDILFFKA